MVPDPVPKPAGSPVIAALGDSFISGEGAASYFEGTNVKGTSECRRAPTAYPNRLVRQPPEVLDDDLVFVACSGDNAIDIYGGTRVSDGKEIHGHNQVKQALDALQGRVPASYCSASAGTMPSSAPSRSARRSRRVLRLGRRGTAT